MHVLQTYEGNLADLLMILLDAAVHSDRACNAHDAAAAGRMQVRWREWQRERQDRPSLWSLSDKLSWEKSAAIFIRRRSQQWLQRPLREMEMKMAFKGNYFNLVDKHSLLQCMQRTSVRNRVWNPRTKLNEQTILTHLHVYTKTRKRFKV